MAIERRSLAMAGWAGSAGKHHRQKRGARTRPRQSPDRAPQGDGDSGWRRDRRGHVRRRALLPGGAARRRWRVRDDTGTMEGEADVAFCGVRPSGHHAEAGRAMGFCLFNNVAIAAEYAICELGLGRVFILDWDVHHGNGTAETFRRRPEVLFASIHQGGIYPGTGRAGRPGSGPGEGYTINLPVPAGSDEDCGSRCSSTCAARGAAFQPELVLSLRGLTLTAPDPLANCRLESELLRRDGPTRARLRPARGVRRSARCSREAMNPQRSQSPSVRRWRWGQR